MSGRRLIPGLTEAWALALPAATRDRLAGIAGSPRRVAASWIAALLGRTELPRLDEIAALRPPMRVLLAGLSGWIVLVVLVTLVAVVSVQMSAVSLPEWLGAPSSTSRGAAARPPASFENIVQRPLFSRSRQGMAASSVPAPLAPPTPSVREQDITLKGVFISGPLAKAFVQSSQNPLGVWVKADEEIAGWKVVTVQPDQVILQGQGERRIVQLHAGATK